MKQPELGKKITELRHRKGLTQAELAEQCKIGLRTVQRIENASVSPRVQTIKLLFDFLEFEYYNSSTKNDLHEQIDKTNINSTKKKSNKIILGLTAFTTLVVIGIFLISSPNRESKPTNMLLGTWELVQFDHGYGLKAVNPNDEKTVKTIAEDHFMWMNFNKTKNVNASAGGTYNYNDNLYIEHIAYGSRDMNRFIGTKSKFAYKVEGETLKIEGSLSSGLIITEEWKKISNPE